MPKGGRGGGRGTRKDRAPNAERSTGGIANPPSTANVLAPDANDASSHGDGSGAPENATENAAGGVGGGNDSYGDGKPAETPRDKSGKSSSATDGESDEEGVPTDAAKRAAPPVKAPPLTEREIAALDQVEQRRVLARWNARLRGLKRRVVDIAQQFPTTSVLFYCSKPLRLDGRRGRWCVRFPE